MLVRDRYPMSSSEKSARHFAAETLLGLANFQKLVKMKARVGKVDLHPKPGAQPRILQENRPFRHPVVPQPVTLYNFATEQKEE